MLRKRAGGSTAARVLSFRDFTGLEIMRVLREAVYLKPGIDTLEPLSGRGTALRRLRGPASALSFITWSGGRSCSCARRGDPGYRGQRAAAPQRIPDLEPLRRHGRRDRARLQDRGASARDGQLSVSSDRSCPSRLSRGRADLGSRTFRRSEADQRKRRALHRRVDARATSSPRLSCANARKDAA